MDEKELMEDFLRDYDQACEERDTDTAYQDRFKMLSESMTETWTNYCAKREEQGQGSHIIDEARSRILNWSADSDDQRALFLPPQICKILSEFLQVPA